MADLLMFFAVPPVMAMRSARSTSDLMEKGPEERSDASCG
jgi:hypothetical protein